MRRMRRSAIMFRLPDYVLDTLDQLAVRLDVSTNIIAKLIVTREVTHIPAMLEEHDRELANMHQFLREIAFQIEDLFEGNASSGGAAITDRLNDVMAALDAIRNASFVRSSNSIADLIRKHDERPIKTSLRI